MRIFTIFAIALLPLLGAVSAAILLCPRCGHEVEPGLAICPHCQASLSAEAEKAPKEPEAPSGPVISRAVISSELAAAQVALKNDEPALAWLRARNAAGLLALAPDARLAGERAGIEREALGLRERERVCPVCKGEGGSRQLFVTINGEANQQKTPGSKCPACGGQRVWRAYATAAQMDSAFVRAQRALFAAIRDAGWMNSGGVWLPPGTTNLTLHQQVAARRAVAGPCETCRGAGATGCETCDGAGKTPCPDQGCVAGKVVCPDCHGTRRITETENGRTITRRCPNCRQTGVTDCPTCFGKSVLTCAACGGTGLRSCVTCRGSGEKALCKTCSGEGMRQGKKGEELCGTCGGTGRGKK